MSDPEEGDAIIDSRQIIRRRDELESYAEDGILDPDERAELEALRSLCEEGESYASDWHHGALLILDDDSVWTRYADGFARDTGIIPDGDAGRYFDLDAFANDLRADFTSITFGSTDYLVR